MTNNDIYQLRFISQSSTYTDSNVWSNLGVGSFGAPYPNGGGIATTGESLPFSYQLVGKISEPGSVNFNPYNAIVGSGTPWLQASGTKSINATPWSLFTNAYFRANYVDFTQDTWDLDFSTAGGLGKTLEFYSSPFSSAVNSFTGTITAASVSEAFIFNGCVGNVAPFNNNASLTVKGGNFIWNNGTVPSLSFAPTNVTGSANVYINGATFNNATTFSAVSDSKADIGVRIENCSVAAGSFSFNGAAGGLITVFTNCLDPANVTAGANTTISPTGNAQCIKVNFSPTGYTVATPPGGWLAAAEQHLQGISNKLDAYGYSGTDATFGTGNILVQRSASGGSVGVFTNNLSNTASSDAFQTVGVAGSSAGDPYTAWGVGSGGQFAQGIDNSDSDNFKRTAAADLNSNVYEVVTSAGEITHPLQPAFSAYQATDLANFSGNSTTYTLGSTTALTEIFDQGSDFNTNGTFTAPVTGLYQFNCGCIVAGCTVATTLQLIIQTSIRQYVYLFVRAAGAQNLNGNISVLANMTAGDTAIVTIATLGEAGNTNTLKGTAANRTFFSGFLVA